MSDLTFYADDGDESVRAAWAVVGPDTPVIFMPDDAKPGDKVTVTTAGELGLATNEEAPRQPEG